MKLFPAPSAGGVGFVKAMRGALPDIGVVPSHGITLGLARRYLLAGAPACILSAAVFPPGAVRLGDGPAVVAAAARLAADLAREFELSSGNGAAEA